MTNAQLRQVMRYYLDHFNSAGVAITDDTKHEDVLSTQGNPNTKDLYEGSVRYSLKASGNGQPTWPNDWMPMTVAELADNLVPAAAVAPATRGAVARSAPVGGGSARVGVPAWFREALGHQAPSAEARRGAKKGSRSKAGRAAGRGK